MKKNKKPLIALVLSLLVGFIGGTLAYYSNSTKYTNRFQLATYKTRTTEKFEAPTNWKAGEEIEKTVITKNEGTIPVAVRASYTEKWTDKDGNTLDIKDAVTINLANTGRWTKQGNYYYYRYIVNPGEETKSFIKSVTLNSGVGEVTCATSNDGLSQVCESLNDATGKKYTLAINIETIDIDKYKSVWNTTLDLIPYGSIITYVNRQNEGVITTGDLLKIGEEEFYVVSSNSDKTTLLAHYNLNVGDNKNTNVTEGIQHSSVKGWLPSTSSNPKYGNISFSATNYWYNGSSLKSEYGDSYPAWVYDSKSNLYTYVENYKTLLETKGVTISEARLLKQEEAVALGCVGSSTWTCSGAPSWVSEISYWLGSANDDGGVWSVISYGGFSRNAYDYAGYFGVRPVIEIPTSEI